MTRPPVLLLLAPLALAACTRPPQPETGRVKPDAQEVAACRTQADREFAAQNRDLMSREDTTYSPFSGFSNRSFPSEGLSQVYAHQQMVQDCLNGRSAQGGETAPAPRTRPGR